MRIGAVFINDVTNLNYRALIPLRELQRRGHTTIPLVLDLHGSIALDKLVDCDVVHVYRAAQPSTLKAAEELSRRGVAITWDNDDDTRLIPKESPYYKQFGGFRGAEWFRRQRGMMTRSSVVTAASEPLAARFREVHDGEVRVIENYLCSEQFARGRREHEGIVIGWVAAGEHRADVGRLAVTETLRRVMERDPRVRVVSIGLRLNLDPSRYTHHRFVQFPDLARYVRQFDIGIAPLSDLPFNHMRSNVKLKEYAAAGVPWLASDAGPYRGLGERQGGLLVQDDGWEEALMALVGDEPRRQALRRAAELWAESQHISRHVGEWTAAFESAKALRAARDAA